ncbi:hypothetical protein NQ318_020405 [Aromia moschata]|uniref:DUF5641 domain-containing protein n=1 Tax=Aromia moschata TaxID=1265417 RepID=A0AAV8Y3G2_9CUCU|nr:hypothetical protein NQ318_020405 [Aromia moschata]
MNYNSESSGNIPKMTLVVIKENNVSTLQWQLGRIVQLHPGPDGISRKLSEQSKKAQFNHTVECCKFDKTKRFQGLRKLQDHYFKLDQGSVKMKLMITVVNQFKTIVVLNFEITVVKETEISDDQFDTQGSLGILETGPEGSPRALHFCNGILNFTVAPSVSCSSLRTFCKAL